MKPLLAYHGTAENFTRFEVPASGIHFGTLDQAAHAATIKLGQLPPDEFAQLTTDLQGWRGRIIKARLLVSNPKRVKDVQSPERWAKEIKKAQREGHDSIVYTNQFEGRKPADSHLLWSTDNIEILNPRFNHVIVSLLYV